MDKIRLKKNSILLKILVPMLILLVLQAFIFTGAVMWGGTIDQMDQNATKILSEKVVNRRNYLQGEMVSRWSNVAMAVDSVNEAAERTAEAYGGYAALERDERAAVSAIESVTGAMIQLLRRNSVTGAFVVFGTDLSDAQEKYGFYLRDLDPTSASEGSSDLLLVRAPRAVVETLPNIAIGTHWDTKFSFKDGMEQPHYAYFRKPLAAAREYEGVGEKDLGYWCAPFDFEGTDQRIMTYSVPLRSASGEAYGVLGVDLSVDYLQKLLPYREVDASNSGAYALAVDYGSDGSFAPVVANGPVYAGAFGPGTEFALGGGKEYGNDCYSVPDVDARRGAVVACVQYLKLYNTNTPFESERWAVVAVLDEGHLFAFSQSIRNTMTVAVAVSGVLGLIAVALVVVWLTKPIRRTIERVRAKRGGEIAVERTGVYEIDELLSAIETLSGSVLEASAKLSRILDAANVPLGAFEMDEAKREVYCTDRFFELIGYPGQSTEDADWERFCEIMRAFDTNFVREQDDGKTRMYCYSSASGTLRWVQMRLVESADKTLGIVQDVTNEVLERQRIERERDYDFLTGLLNGQSFKMRMERALEERTDLGTGALLVVGVDNLKYVNDTFGYDYGDDFLRRVGHAIGDFPAAKLLAGRSADEFFVFLYGYPEAAPVERDVAELRKALRSVAVSLPDGNVVEARPSCGYALYPRDASSYDALYRYADFALFECEHECRGEFHPFIPKNYSESAYLLQNREELTKLIEQELVEYYFQPIVDVQTGRVFGYEALMRSKLSTIKSPQEVLSLARSQSKLAQIERLTWFNAMESYRKNAEAFGERKIFINSISNQVLSDEDVALFEKKFEPYLGKIVLEFTEDERLNEAFMHKKRSYIVRWTGKIALDDFGTGYNGDIVLLTLAPNFIKIDMSIIQGIHTDDNRRSLFMNILSYAKERGIKVIAEGVETFEEMRTLIACGVDYLQGFYLGRPAPEPRQIPKEVRKEILACRAES